MSWGPAVYFTDFPTQGPAATVLGPEWTVYDFSPGNNGWGVRRPSAASVVAEGTASGNVLQFVASNGTGADTGKLVHAGVALLTPAMRYGQFEIRVRCTGDPDKVTSMVCLLWPADDPVRFPFGRGPDGGELDFWETFDNRDTRTPVEAHIHRLKPGATPPYTYSDDEALHFAHDAGFVGTAWHKVVFSWSPDQISVAIDNGTDRVLTSDPGWIPVSGDTEPWNMVLTLQLDAWDSPSNPGVQPVLSGGNNPTMQIDYVVVYPWVEPPPPPELGPQFPEITLDTTVEMAFGATGNPTTWTWTDVGANDRLLSQAITIRRGSAEEAGDLQPASATVTLDNGDGHLMPNNPTSPWWPYVRRGTPLRISVPSRTPALLIPDVAGSFVSTPDNAVLDFAGDIDLRILIQPDHWSTGIHWTNGNQTIDIAMRLITKWDASGNQSWAWSLWDAGWLSFEWSTDGTQGANQFRITDQLTAAWRPQWLAVTLDVDDGNNQNVTTLYRWDGDGTPPADVTNWSIIDQFTASGVATVHAGTAPVRIGSLVGNDSAPGKIYKAELRSGINGTPVANPDFRAEVPGTTSFADAAGRTWTLNAPAAISAGHHIRFVGEIDEIVPSWPFGDNNPTGQGHPSEARVTITASDLVRRLSQGPAPLQSTLTRGVLAHRAIPHVIAYWPCEDTTGSVHLAAALDTHSALTVTTTVEAGTDSTLTASAPLPKVKPNEEANWSGVVPAGPADHWAVEWMFNLPTPAIEPATTSLITVATDGTAHAWDFTVSDTATRLRIYDPLGVQLVANNTTNFQIFDRWILARIEAQQSGANISWSWTVVNLETGGIGGNSGTFAGTLGSVRGVSNILTSPADGLSFGHIIVTDGALGVGWLAGADTAWVGETAAHRIFRLCAEENIPIELHGDPSAWSLKRGSLALSQAMGPQQRLPLVQLLTQCAQVDLGVLANRRTALGFMYRTRRTLENQVPAMTLDATSNAVSVPLELYLDDQRLRNDVTITSTAGSSARVRDVVHIDQEGLYRTDTPINGVGGVPIQTGILITQPGLTQAVEDQNRQQASWRVHLGTWAELRYPTLIVDLALVPDLIDMWLSVELGDRVTLTGLPVQHPVTSVDLIIEAVAETITPTRWTLELTCGPGGPWQVGVLDA